jgi:predicted Co/Zn/Cd cation transporter (cation efflux family)
MVIDTGTMLAIIIALAGSCFVMVVSINAYGKLMRENKQLRKELVEMEWKMVREVK